MLQPSLTQPPHQTPEPSLRDRGPWWLISTPMWPQPGQQGLWAPLGPRLPPWQAGRRVEGSGSRQPEVCARAYISHQLFLPRAARKPGGPGLPLPRLVKPAQRLPRPGGALVPGCHQRLPPATEAQRCPNSLPWVQPGCRCPGKTTGQCTPLPDHRFTTMSNGHTSPTSNQPPGRPEDPSQGPSWPPHPSLHQ